MSRTATHALDEITSVRHGAVVGCRCGWVAHVTERGGSDQSYRGGAREAFRAHKADPSEPARPAGAGRHAYDPDERGLCRECGGAAIICQGTR